MTGDTEFTSDLTLEGLNDDLDITIEDVLSPEITTTKTSTEDDSVVTNTTSEENKSPESVAEDDLDKGTPETESDSTSPGDDENLSQLYSSLATHFKKEGVLPSLENESEIKSVKDMQKAIQTEINNAKSESQKVFDEAMKEGVPKDSIIAYEKQRQQLDSLTDDVLEADDERATNLRFNIIAQDFLNKGFSKEEAAKQAKRSVDLGEDLSDSKLALTRLKDFNEQGFEKAKVESKQKVETEQNEIKKFIDSTDEILKGVKLTKNVRDKLYNQMVNVISSENDKPLNEYAKSYKEDPVRFQVMQNYMYMITKGYSDFSKINSVATSAVSKGIDDILKNTGTSFLENGSLGQSRDTNSSFSIGDDFDIG